MESEQTERRHTPGPWRRVRWPHAGIWYVMGPGEDESVADAWTKADANLIAAAPDLLAALEVLLDAPRIRGWSEPSINVNERVNHAMTQAEAAIAKARGQVPS